MAIQQGLGVVRCDKRLMRRLCIGIFAATAVSILGETYVLAQAPTLPPTLSEIVEQIDASQSRFPGVSETIHNTHSDPATDAQIAKKKLQPVPRGMRVTMTGGSGDYDYFSAFTKDQDIWVGGRASPFIYAPGTDIEGVLHSRRTVSKGDKTYLVEVSKGVSLAVEAQRKTPIIGSKDLGWRIPGSTQTLVDEIKSRQFKVTGGSQDPKWGPVFTLVGEWNYYNRNKKVTINVASERDYLIVSCDSDYDGRLTSFRVNKMDKIKGFWIPTDARSDRTDEQTGSILSSDTYTVTKVDIGGLTPAQWSETLAFNLVLDSKTGTKYNVSSTGERVMVRRPTSANAAGKFAAGWLYIASIATMLVLTLGAYVRWKCRQLAKPV